MLCQDGPSDLILDGAAFENEKETFLEKLLPAGARQAFRPHFGCTRLQVFKPSSLAGVAWGINGFLQGSMYPFSKSMDSLGKSTEFLEKGQES